MGRSDSSAGTRKRSHLRFSARTKLLAGLCLAVSAITVAGCGSSSSSSAGASSPSSGASSAASGKSNPLNVLAILDTGGPTKVYGSQELLGLQAAARYYNAAGGILGHKVVITAANDNGDPATSASIAEQRLSSDTGKYAMVWAGAEGNTTAALEPILKRFNVFAAATTDGAGACVVASACPRQFSIFGPNSLPELGDTNYFRSHGIKKVGLLAEQTAFTQGELGFIQKDLSHAGIRAVTSSFPATAVSVTPELAALKTAGVQAVFAMANGISTGYVLNARSALGWPVPLLFDAAGSTSDIATLAPKSGLKNVSETIEYCENSQFKDSGLTDLAKYSPSALVATLPCDVSTGGWDGIVLLKEAATKANSVAPSALVSATESLKAHTGQPGFDFAAFQGYCWSHANHENGCNAASDYEVVPVGRLVHTRLVPLG
jgi:ABC-type branched-subunit amino acid transport system substrate-binding protein